MTTKGAKWPLKFTITWILQFLLVVVQTQMVIHRFTLAVGHPLVPLLSVSKVVSFLLEETIDLQKLKYLQATAVIVNKLNQQHINQGP